MKIVVSENKMEVVKQMLDVAGKFFNLAKAGYKTEELVYLVDVEGQNEGLVSITQRSVRAMAAAAVLAHTSRGITRDDINKLDELDLEETASMFTTLAEEASDS